MKRRLETSCPVAFKSLDHLMPWGTKRDMSRQLRFEAKLFKVMEHKKFDKILDLGCSGGAFISNMHDLGFIAIGLEGSDYSKKNKRGPWAYLADHVLYTCDITKPFKIFLGKEKKTARLDVITAFEVLEHLSEDQLNGLFRNLLSHSHNDTRLIFSISTNDDVVHGVNLHQTVKPRSWWEKTFEKFGWIMCTNSIRYFNGQYLRGNRFGANDSFEIVLKRKNCKDSDLPHLTFFDRILDLNSGSRFQKALFRIIHGDRISNSF